LVLLGSALGACQFPDYGVVTRGAAGSPSVTAGTSSTGGSHETEGGSPAVLPDPCAPNPCLQDSRCIPVDGSFVCLCPDGFRGDTCELNFDNCDPDPCQNGGTCVDGVDSASCACADGWEGTTCQRSIDDCAPNPCLNGGTCVDGFKSHSCNCVPGFTGAECSGSLPATCLALLQADASATSGVYSVDPDGPGQGNAPLEVLCDMTRAGGGWTRVGEERQGDTGTFKFLGISVGNPSRSAHNGDSALMGEQFQTLYDEIMLVWTSTEGGGGDMHFRVNEEVFVNNVRKAMPVSGFATSDSRLSGWVNTAGGAIFCRGSESPGVRPGDSSWAVKPKDDKEMGCGCNSAGWYGRGAFYGGHPDANQCTPSSGGWYGAGGDGEDRANVDKFELQIWIR
jgi:EGF-like domain